MLGSGDLAQVDDQRYGIQTGQFLCPADDELLGVGVEVLLLERRGVQRVEQLTDFAQADFDPLARPIDGFGSLGVLDTATEHGSVLRVSW
jgi:hypothetical protein